MWTISYQRKYFHKLLGDGSMSIFPIYRILTEFQQIMISKYWNSTSEETTYHRNPGHHDSDDTSIIEVFRLD